MRVFILWLFIIFTFILTDKSKTGSQTSTNQDKDPLFSFGLVADVQYCDCDPAGTRFYRSSLLKLSEAVEVFRRDSVNFVINLGDLIEKEMGSFTPVLDTFGSSGLKILHIPGNHDYSVGSENKNKIPVLRDQQKGYYSEKVEGFRLIFLDGNEISTYSSENKEVILPAGEYIKQMKINEEINAFDWNGGIGKDQLQWLRNELTAAKTENEKVIIFCHFPIAPENIHNLLNYREILAVIGKYRNIAAWVSGHNHSGNYAVIDGVHFITMKGMVETETTNSYGIIQVYDNRLEVKGFGAEKNRILHLHNDNR